MSSKQENVSKLRLVLVQGDNYGNVLGDYTRTDDMVRSKNIWVSQSNGRMMFYSGASWVITSTQYMQEVLDGATGGFVSSRSNADVPYEADWGPNYKVSEVYLSDESEWVPTDVSQLRLILVQGDNYGNVPGDYTRTDDMVRGKNIWVSQSNGRMMFCSGASWVITSTQYMQEVLDGATGGFVSSKSNADVPYEADWGPNYKVSVYLSVEKRWLPVEPVAVFRSPSVHTWWSSPANPQVQQGATWFYNEITVTKAADSTYYMTNGFTGGYMGIQDRSPKWVIFSVWDKTSTDDNPNASPDDLVKVLAQGQGVTVERFGGEGTGGKSYLAYDWKVGQTYQLMVNVRPDPHSSDKVVFTGWFRIPEQNIWRMLASFQVRPQAVSKKLEGIYSFIEDWIGNGQRRQGLWGPAWIRTDDGPWVQATHGNGSTTEQDANNRNVFLSDDKKQIGMTSGGPALDDLSLGPFDVAPSPIPPVLTLNPLPDYDGAPARVQ